MKRLFALAVVGTMVAGGAQATTWDTNDDGSIDAEEFAKGNLSSATFKRFDDDGNGAISPHEVGLDAPDEIFKRADDNNDGQLTPSELTVATFYTYDFNQDNKLDEDEMRVYEYDENARSRPFAADPAIRKGAGVSQ